MVSVGAYMRLFLLVAVQRAAILFVECRGRRSSDDAPSAARSLLDSGQGGRSDRGNYGLPFYDGAQLYTTDVHALNRRCDFDAELHEPVAARWPTFMAFHYTNNSQFDAFEGVDLLPHNRATLPEYSGWARHTHAVNTTKTTRQGPRSAAAAAAGLWGGGDTGAAPSSRGRDYREIKYADCILPVAGNKKAAPARAAVGDDDDEWWTLQRVGPFDSYGGYDWWQFGGKDLFKFGASKLLDGNRKLALLEFYVAAVDGDGKPFSYPPLHMHHVHVIPEKPFLQYQWPWHGLGAPINKQDVIGTSEIRELVKRGRDETFWRYLLRVMASLYPAYTPNWVFEQHGEYDMCDMINTSGCFAEKLPAGYGKLIDFSLDFEGEINDARKAGSEKLTWYLEFGVRWKHHDHRDLKPASRLIFGGPQLLERSGKQSTYQNVYNVPTSEPSLTWYEAEMPLAGKLLHMKPHNHMAVTHKLFLVRGSAAELGLENTSWPPLRPPQDGNELGEQFASKPVLFLSDLGFTNFDDLERYLFQQQSKKNQRNAVICTVLPTLERVDGYLFDRAGNTTCNFWNFQEGDIVTSIAFHNHTGEATMWSPDEVIKLFPVHNVWNMIFEADDSASHYVWYISLEYLAKRFPEPWRQFWMRICVFTRQYHSRTVYTIDAYWHFVWTHPLESAIYVCWLGIVLGIMSVVVHSAVKATGLRHSSYKSQ